MLVVLVPVILTRNHTRDETTHTRACDAPCENLLFYKYVTLLEVCASLIQVYVSFTTGSAAKYHKHRVHIVSVRKQRDRT
jgi:hypothetical protein